MPSPTGSPSSLPDPSLPPPPRRSARGWRAHAAAVLLLGSVAFVALQVGGLASAAWARSPAPAQAATGSAAESAAAAGGSQATGSSNELTAPKAVLLGVIEGLTEFLPVSSTGHLLVAERIIDIGQNDATKQAADTYTIAIQVGALLAVVVLYFGRIRRMIDGALGRDPGGRHTLVAVIVAFIPAAVVGLLGEKFITKHLLAVGPVVAAWIVGAIVIFAWADRFSSNTGGTGLDVITVRQALIIGAAQCLAMWPGTSRSLVTILAALFVGMTLASAVEFSFLLGLLTVSAASAYGLLKHGGELLDVYGWVNPLIGLVVAFFAALVAVRWMVTYLQRHSLAIFGWYRLGLAAITIGLLVTGVI